MSQRRKFPNWVPRDIARWCEKRNIKIEAYDKFIYDPRMIDVWKWFEHGRPHSMKTTIGLDDQGNHILVEEESPSCSMFLICLSRATTLPPKPSDMTPKDREKYLVKVREHATALISLLEDTMYDRHIFHIGAESIDPDKVEERVLDQIRSMVSWSKSEEGGLLVAYETDDDGDVYEHGWNYPNSSLVDTLKGLVEWSRSDDYFDLLHSVKAIRHSGIRGRKTLYLDRLRRSLKTYGVEMPFAHYATVTNVALQLSESEELNEVSARKQIERIIERRKESDKETDTEDHPF